MSEHPAGLWMRPDGTTRLQARPEGGMDIDDRTGSTGHSQGRITMMNEQAARRLRTQARKRHNEEFYEQLRKRRPEAKDELADLALKVFTEGVPMAEARAAAPVRPEALPDLALETLVREERPVLFVENDWINQVEVTVKGAEARDLIEQVERNRESLEPLIPLIGRIDVANFPGSDYVGTGWFVGPDIVVTNRHVASLVARWDGRRFVFRRGVAARPIEAALSTVHEFDDLVDDPARSFPVMEVLYIEPETGPDMAFLRVLRRTTDGTRPSFIPVAEADVGENVPVLVVGYPARASKSVIPDQDLMRYPVSGTMDGAASSGPGSPGRSGNAKAKPRAHGFRTISN
jgi:hypothetical protein